MTLSELIATVRWADVKDSLIWGYQDAEASLEDYQRVLKSLRKLDPVPSTMRIVIRKTFPEDLGGASVTAPPYAPATDIDRPLPV